MECSAVQCSRVGAVLKGLFKGWSVGRYVPAEQSRAEQDE